MRKLRQHRVAIGIALTAILLAALMPAIAQWRAAMQRDPFAVYCTVQGAQAALGASTAPRVDAQREPAHDGHSGHDDAQAPPINAEAASLHGQYSEHGGGDHSLASAQHWEKCGYCTLWSHQPLVTTDLLSLPPASAPGVSTAPRVLVPHYPRVRFYAALARAPPALSV
ncbi:DUF2946 domain-containing protein [Pandoraea nosoerga]|uniref:DUF2946 domain-containing protein n=1 Tax=Pandoraea nosoerga TaxID=2508296 RepID=A0A5E4RHT3_9BURK|nr:DUF2946 family protein [Pandoraea nosoerga]MBN4664437.1 DUF2946 domain-containing protein [Pandoraea nosoerga]MBN4674527.1 DUF2946 domain-containing protein [Pandoraea nosoerga]MBN4679795.1 DUF2946 domain-containing protein [Pandoraea nosoerga]MBN4743118.1 DUF2946 domain-containing protein [Pandoraea nosoerga]VVD62371.1 hypothetical protein PNO31109_00164 [Pandoraea nosoerga]